MTRLFLVTQGDRKIWVAAVVDEDVWTYVGNTGKFHFNEGIREDYFMNGAAQYAEIGVTEAKRLIAAGVGQIDAEKEPVRAQDWLADHDTMDPDVVFASMVADLG
jgi:hypothetical protein